MDASISNKPARALVFGASGQIGRALLATLLGQGWAVTAVSREPQEKTPGIAWVLGDFHACWEGPRQFDAVFSCGPLNHFVTWFTQGPLQVSHVVAFSSTSAQVKQHSQERAERDLAADLSASEQDLMRYCRGRRVSATILRPTLIWGSGRDLTVSRIAKLGKRRRLFVVPANASGLRQPVHVQDLADAAAGVVNHPACSGQVYDLPGGETLSYLEMVRRIQLAMPSPPPLLQVPDRLFSAVVWVAQCWGKLPGVSQATLHRMECNLVFDIGPAQRDFGYAPRGFSPSVAELGLDQ